MLKSCLIRIPALVLTTFAWLLGAADAPAASGTGPTNRLANEASPYLQLHRFNPVDWYPWGDEAIAKAREQQKPIFLSVGYSTCFWCHVMERKVFSDPQIAALMNRHFVNIKVDREERPDIDEIYMTATQMMTGSGGWPNSVFLTPDGAPFFAGTYFPPKDQGQRPGFPRVLKHLADSWQNDRENVLAMAARVREQIASRSAAPPDANTSFDPVALLSQATRQLARSYESNHGGFSNRIKFPNPPKLELLIAAHHANPTGAALAMLTQTLDEMALGGLYDHLAGGFHRYSTEATWSIPHYEKMLYDNGQLLGVYALAYEVTGRPLYRRVANEIADYLAREMRHPDGGFYSAQDAEVDGHEGLSYLWTREQIEAELGADRAGAFLSVYGLTRMPEGEGQALRVQLPVDPALDQFHAADPAELLSGFSADRAKLLAARNQRKQPLRDDKVLAAWNGLAIRGLVEAARALKRPDLLALAESAADFVWQRLVGEDGRLHRSYIAGQVRENAVLQDYAYLADGLLALYRATGDESRLKRVRELVDSMLALFEDPVAGGFFLTPSSSELIARPRVIYDDVEPSGSAVAMRVLIALASLDPSYAAALERTMHSFGAALDKSPASVGSAVVAMQALDTKPADPIALKASRQNRNTLPRSTDHVHVEVSRKSADAISVRVRIDAGWHVNANPASLDYLIPTTVEFDGAERATIQYPDGEEFAPSFSPLALSTYAGTIEIPVQLGTGNSSASSLLVRFQACDQTQCLPPSTARAQIP